MGGATLLLLLGNQVPAVAAPPPVAVDFGTWIVLFASRPVVPPAPSAPGPDWTQTQSAAASAGPDWTQTQSAAPAPAAPDWMQTTTA